MRLGGVWGVGGEGEGRAPVPAPWLVGRIDKYKPPERLPGPPIHLRYCPALEERKKLNSSFTYLFILGYLL